jgi:hypothetical protein
MSFGYALRVKSQNRKPPTPSENIPIKTTPSQ